MGENKIMKRSSLKKQFVFNFFIILFFSVVATVVTVLILFAAINLKIINPENHYEQLVPQFEEYIKNNGYNVLNLERKEDILKLIDEEGMEYEILDLQGRYIHGTSHFLPMDSKDVLYKINTIDYRKDWNLERGYTNNIPINYASIKYIPVEYNGELKAIAIIKYNYRISSLFINNNLMKVINLYLFICPFFYLVIFTIIFIGKLNKRINKPINELIKASNNIKNKNLDFTINYDGDDELGDLITSFTNMKDELKNTLIKNWNMEEERNNVTSAIAHDIKTPLTIIRGHVEILEEIDLRNQEKAQKHLKVIKQNTDRATKLIENMNYISKINRADFNLILEEVNIKDFVIEKETEFKLLCKEKNINFICEIYNEKNNNIAIFDKDKISQVLDNLIINSLRFTESGGNINLIISIYDEKIRFIIKDDGIGFSTKDMNNLFNSFYQGDSSRSLEKGHSGLGLYMCKIIVEKHNGKIFAHNDENGGAVVEFYINQ